MEQRGLRNYRRRRGDDDVAERERDGGGVYVALDARIAKQSPRERVFEQARKKEEYVKEEGVGGEKGAAERKKERGIHTDRLPAIVGACVHCVCCGGGGVEDTHTHTQTP